MRDKGQSVSRNTIGHTFNPSPDSAAHMKYMKSLRTRRRNWEELKDGDKLPQLYEPVRMQPNGFDCREKPLQLGKMPFHSQLDCDFGIYSRLFINNGDASSRSRNKPLARGDQINPQETQAEKSDKRKGTKFEDVFTDTDAGEHLLIQRHKLSASKVRNVVRIV